MLKNDREAMIGTQETHNCWKYGWSLPSRTNLNQVITHLFVKAQVKSLHIEQSPPSPTPT